jgi:hypothetical protein
MMRMTSIADAYRVSSKRTDRYNFDYYPSNFPLPRIVFPRPWSPPLFGVPSGRDWFLWSFTRLETSFLAAFTISFHDGI